MSEVKYRGGCACGAIRVELAAEPAGPYQCFCRQCQSVSGGNAAIFVMLPRKDFHIVEGEPVSHEQETGSGREASRSFCGRCGTPIFSEPRSAEGMVAVKLGAIEKAPWESVKAIFWTSEMPRWAIIDPNAKQFETQ